MTSHAVRHAQNQFQSALAAHTLFHSNSSVNKSLVEIEEIVLRKCMKTITLSFDVFKVWQ